MIFSLRLYKTLDIYYDSYYLIVMHPKTQIFWILFFISFAMGHFDWPTIKNILKRKYFTMQKYNLQKKASTRNQNPSGWLELYK
jgi:hypothetical protein